VKKIIDERGRLFGLISIIDVLVLIAVIILGFAVFTRFDVRDNPLTTVNTVPVTYTVKLPVVREAVAELIRPGDNLYIETRAFVGTIKSVSSEIAEVTESLLDGTLVLAPAHERYDITLTVEVQCSFSNGRYYADRVFELNANAEYMFQTKYVYTTGVIMSIDT